MAVEQRDQNDKIAIFLFQKTKLTLAQAASFAETNRINFQHLLASRNIPIHYDSNDFDQDLQIVTDILNENCQ